MLGRRGQLLGIVPTPLNQHRPEHRATARRRRFEPSAPDMTQHTHITQSRRSPVDGCPACALIRPAVMTIPAYVLASIDPERAAFEFGPVPRPERPAR